MYDQTSLCLAQFPGDIYQPVATVARVANPSYKAQVENLLIFLYKSQFGDIDRLASYDIDAHEWKPIRYLVGWKDGCPGSYDSGVVAAVTHDDTFCRLFLCTVDICRPMWSINIWCLDVETCVWSLFSRFFVEFFHAEQRINLSLTPDGCLLIALKYPWDKIFEVWVNVPPLQLLCWNSLIGQYPEIETFSGDKLRNLGIPYSFLQKYRLCKCLY